jgi:hypothetical protein
MACCILCVWLVECDTDVQMLFPVTNTWAYHDSCIFASTRVRGPFPCTHGDRSGATVTPRWLSCLTALNSVFAAGV